MTRPAVLVTGAAGFAGSHLLDLLHADGARVVAWRRPGIGAEVQQQYPWVEWREVELLDRQDTRAQLAMVAPAFVYHLAGAPHVGESWKATTDTLAVNVLGTHHVLDGIRAAGLQTRVVVPSSSYVYRPSGHALTEEDPIQSTSPYALSKIATELAAEHASRYDGVPVVVARSFNHIGPRQDPTFFAPAVARQIALIEKGRLEPVIKVGNIDAKRDFTDVRDTVRAYKSLVEGGSAGRIYNVCSGVPRTIRSLLDILMAHSTVGLSVEVDPERFRPNDMPIIVGDPTRIRKELGWSPVVPIERSLLDLLEYWRKTV
ncbi:MAG: GDP-mannose 4,6-dehydratase [Acidobacteriota bacterium]